MELRTYSIGDFIVNVTENYVEVIDSILGKYWKKEDDFDVCFGTAIDAVLDYSKETEPSMFDFITKFVGTL